MKLKHYLHAVTQALSFKIARARKRERVPNPNKERGTEKTATHKQCDTIYNVSLMAICVLGINMAFAPLFDPYGGLFFFFTCLTWCILWIVKTYVGENTKP